MQSHKPIAKDVAEWIEHSKVSEMIKNVDDDEKQKINILTTGSNTSTRGLVSEKWFLTRDGLFEVLMQNFIPCKRCC